jgi:hypothetical protein
VEVVEATHLADIDRVQVRAEQLYAEARGAGPSLVAGHVKRARFAEKDLAQVPS